MVVCAFKRNTEHLNQLNSHRTQTFPKKHTQSHTQDKSSETHACKHREFMQTGHFVFAVLYFQDQEHKTP